MEAGALTRTYPILRGKVRKQVISGLHCVVMPYFKPINQAERLTPEMEGKVRSALRLLHRTGKRYHRHDIRWSRVGEYENEVILFGLANLTTLDAGKGKPADDHMAVLIKQAERDAKVHHMFDSYASRQY